MGSEIAKTYESNGQEITVTAQDVVDYICPLATPAEVKMFLEMCAAYGLNPYVKDAHLVKYKQNQPATMVVGKDYYTKAAASNPSFDGMKAGISVIGTDGAFHRREGSLVMPGETLVGGWASVQVKGRSIPSFEEVGFDEYAGRKYDGSLNSQWKSKPATMIRKCAVVHALREAFPANFAGLYDEAEMGVDTAQPQPQTQQPAEQPQEAEQVYEETI